MQNTQYIPVANELKSANAFDKQSKIFDEIYSQNTIIKYKRKRVREHVEKLIGDGSFILELNAGTGEDALYFAELGHRVHATDISGGMQKVLAGKVKNKGLNDRVSTEICSYTNLENLCNRGPYDLIFSNFAGLNCTDKLNIVLQSFLPLLKPGGVITLVVLPKFCLWESLLLLKGKFKTAFRRFFSGKGVKAHIDGEYFTCWYYNPSYITKHLRADFEIVGLEGLCTIVPPSYIENFAEKYPKLYAFLVKKEGKFKSSWPWKFIGDYYIISLRKKQVTQR